MLEIDILCRVDDLFYVVLLFSSNKYSPNSLQVCKKRGEERVDNDDAFKKKQPYVGRLLD